MTRQTDLLNLNENADNKKYKFLVVRSGGGIIPIVYQLKYAPDGWKDEITFERNEKYKGVFRTYSSNEIKFPKDGRDHLKDIYESKGVSEIAELYVYKWDNESFEFILTFVGKIDFSTYTVDELFVSVQVLDNSFTEKVKNRENIEVDLITTKTINGSVMPDFAVANTNLTFPTLQITSQANWVREALSQTTFSSGVPLGPTNPNYFAMPLTFSQIAEAQSITPPWVGAQYFINGASDDFTARLTVKLKAKLYNLTGGNATSYGIILTVSGADGGDVVIASNATYGTSEVTLDVDAVQMLAVSSGAQLSLHFTLTRNPEYCSGCIRYLDVWGIDIKFEYYVSTLSQHFITALPYYEALLRNIQKITNQYDCFYSDFFGRTDSEIIAYGSDGQLGHLTKGTLIRYLDNTLDVNFPVTLESLFKSLSSLFNLGLGVETFTGTKKVRVEELSYFFDDTIVLDLSDRISEQLIGKEVLPEWHYAQIKTGYTKVMNEFKGAIFEYNAKQTYATEIDSLTPINNTLDIVSKFRADTNGIIVLREEYLSLNSKDVKGDDDIFSIDTVRDPLGDSEFRARTDEDFILIDGTIDSDQYYNYFYTPKRCMLRHGMNIRAGLERNLNSYITFQTTDKMVDLTTQLNTEAIPVVEGTDERVNDLTEPMWWAEAYTVEECPFYLSDLVLLEANPRGIIKLADDKFGWVLEIKTRADDKASLKLLRVNTDYVTPV